MFPPSYSTLRFELHSYNKEDENRFVEMAIDKESVTFMGGATGNIKEERKLFNKIFKLYNKEQDRLFWIWGIYENKQLVGHLELKESEHTNKEELEVVYMIHPDSRGKGVMTEILKFLKKEQSKWSKRIIATTSTTNKKSITLLQKWGIEKKEMLTDNETGEVYYKFLLTK